MVWGRALFILIAVIVAGCAQPAAEVPPVAEESAPPTAHLASYLHNTSEKNAARDAEAVVEHYRLPGANGKMLDAWVRIPPSDEPIPVLLEISVYHGGGNPWASAVGGRTTAWISNVFVPYGYAVGVITGPGRGGSEGCYTWGADSEARDMAAAIEALAAEPWSNGRVGLIALDQSAYDARAVWIEGPPSLASVVTYRGVTSRYDSMFVNGVAHYAAAGDEASNLWPYGLPIYDGAHETARPGACPESIEFSQAFAESARTGDKTPYWQARDLLPRFEKAPEIPRASAFTYYDLNDDYEAEDWFAMTTQANVSRKTMAAPFISAFTLDHPDRPGWIDPTLLAWLDQTLKGVDTGILDAPMVQVRDQAGTWRHEAAWPVDAPRRALYPTTAGTLADAPDGAAVSLSNGGGRGTPSIYCSGGQPLQRPVEVPAGPESVAYDMQISAPMYLSGRATFTANVTVDGDRAALWARLFEVLPDGTTRTAAWAIQSLNHWETVEKGKDSVNGITQRVSLSFHLAEWEFHVGNVLRLRLFTAPEADCQSATGDGYGTPATIHIADGVLELPLLQARVLEDAPPDVE